MPYAPQYMQFVEAEISVSKTLVRPRNVYSIKSYTDVNGKTHTYVGAKAAIVFVLGIADQKLWCLKLTDVRPTIFWKWMAPLLKKNVIVDDKIKKLEDLLLVDTRNGKKIFENFVKSKTIYNIEPAAFRSYNLSGVNLIKELKFDLNFLKKQYGLKSEEINSEYKDPKVEQKKTSKVKNDEQKVKESQPQSDSPISKAVKGKD